MSAARNQSSNQGTNPSTNTSTCQQDSQSCPVPLQLQCLLYLVGHLDELPTSSLALLPSKIRHELFLLLPAVDVCQLEHTPVGVDLNMEEIWKTLNSNKILVSELRCYPDIEQFMSRDDKQIRYNISLTWKETYFEAVFIIFLTQGCDVSSLINCQCYPEHLLFDVLFGVFHLDDEYQYVLPISSSLQGLIRSSGNCVRFTPDRYNNSLLERGHSVMSFDYFADILVNTCQVSLKIFDQGGCYSDDLWSDVRDLTKPYITSLLESVEVVCLNGENDEHLPPSKIFDLVFFNPHQCVKTLVLTGYSDPLLDYIENYLKNTKLSTIILEDTNWISNSLSSIIEKQSSLEYLVITYCIVITLPSGMIRLIERLSSLKKVTISLCTLSVKAQRNLIDAFILSPHPFHLHLEKIKSTLCEDGKDMLHETITEMTKVVSCDNNKGQNKTLTVINCELLVGLLNDI